MHSEGWCIRKGSRVYACGGRRASPTRESVIAPVGPSGRGLLRGDARQ